LSAAQEINRDYGIPCTAIAELDDLIHFLENQGNDEIDLAALQRYREDYGT
jgi:orotate phosphoribosyltransferase